MRLQVIAGVEPKSSVADVLFYKYQGSAEVNMALLERNDEEYALYKEDIRKIIIRRLLSRSFLKSYVERSECICEMVLFSIDPISEIDHSFFLNNQTLEYKYCSYDFNGNVLLKKGYDFDSRLQHISEADFELLECEEYFPSKFIESVFKDKINKVVLGDSRTHSIDLPFGISLSDIRAKALDYGQGDFDTPYMNISSCDKVNLYCYLNLKKHFFTTYAIIERLFASLGPIENIKEVNFLDYGCGPLTSGLAIADYYFSRTNMKLKISYTGIDISSNMIDKAKEFSRLECFSRLSTFNFFKDLGRSELAEFVNSSSENGCVNIINFSYLFASNSLNVEDLSDKLRYLENIKGPSFLLYQNSTIENKNKSWAEFKKHFELILLFSGDRNIKYHNSNYKHGIPKQEKVKFEILSLIQRTHTI